MSIIGSNNTDPINKDNTVTPWPLDITIIHSLAILRHNLNFQLEQYSPVTVTLSLVCVRPGPVHVSLGPECVDTAPVPVILSPV